MTFSGLVAGIIGPGARASSNFVIGPPKDTSREPNFSWDTPVWEQASKILQRSFAFGKGSVFIHGVGFGEIGVEPVFLVFCIILFPPPCADLFLLRC